MSTQQSEFRIYELENSDGEFQGVRFTINGELTENPVNNKVLGQIQQTAYGSNKDPLRLHYLVPETYGSEQAKQMLRESRVPEISKGDTVCIYGPENPDAKTYLKLVRSIWADQNHMVQKGNPHKVRRVFSCTETIYTRLGKAYNQLLGEQDEVLAKRRQTLRAAASIVVKIRPDLQTQLLETAATLQNTEITIEDMLTKAEIRQD